LAVDIIGLARHNYESPHGSCSAQSTRPATTTPTTPARADWMTKILPYFEQGSVFQLYSSNLDWDDPANQAAGRVGLNVFLCPSADQGREEFEYTHFTTSTPRFFLYAKPTDYTNVGRIGPSLAATLSPPPVDTTGVLGTQPVKIAQVSDGLSNTILVTECANRPQLWQRRQLVSQLPPSAPWSSSSDKPFVTGGVWASHLKGFLIDGAGSDGRTNGGPCAMNCSNDNEIYSFHSGGANALMADGSDRFLHESMDVRTLTALATRAGGEVINEEY
jgi:prepilin-type processing-associated H-X9-DG protein